MPYKSTAQQRYLESSKSPLSEKQKKEFRGKTNFSQLPEKVHSAAREVVKNKGKKKDKK